MATVSYAAEVVHPDLTSHFCPKIHSIWRINYFAGWHGNANLIMKFDSETRELIDCRVRQKELNRSKLEDSKVISIYPLPDPDTSVKSGQQGLTFSYHSSAQISEFALEKAVKAWQQGYDKATEDCNRTIEKMIQDLTKERDEWKNKFEIASDVIRVNKEIEKVFGTSDIFSK